MEEIKVCWDLFEKADYSGQGAFGDVLKVKCKQSSCLYNDATSRIKMTAAQEKKAKKDRLMAEEVAGRNAAVLIDLKKSLFEQEFYVIKTINVSHLDEKDQIEALNEIETM